MTVVMVFDVDKGRARQEESRLTAPLPECVTAWNGAVYVFDPHGPHSPASTDARHASAGGRAFRGINGVWGMGDGCWFGPLDHRLAYAVTPTECIPR